MVTNKSASSIHEFKLPDLGEGMHEAEIVEWLIKPGDTLKLDQTMVKVETDKAIVEIPSPIAGRVSEIRVQGGQVAKVGDVLVVFETPPNADASTPTKGIVGGPLAGALSPHSPVGALPPAPSALQPTTAPPQPTTARPRVLAAPAVRKLAFELGVDLEQVAPSQATGRVTIDDVRAYAEHATASTPPASSAPQAVGAREESGGEGPVGVGELVSALSASPGGLVSTRWGEEPISPTQENREPLKGLRKRIAEHMERAWHIVPHATAFDEVDGSRLVALRQSLKPEAEKRGVHLTYIPILIKLLIPVLKQFPIFNASLDEDRREIVYKRSYHIGVATASPEGLLVPVLRNVDQLTLLDIAHELERLIEGARKRTLSLPELSGSTFTLNNVGSFGGGSGIPIINYPEVAILAVGRLQEKAIVEQGQVLVRPMMPLTLSFDHRLIDGAMSAAFLARFKELVENPQQLLLDMI